MPQSGAATSKSGDLAKWAHRRKVTRITMVPMQADKGKRQNNHIIVIEDSMTNATSTVIWIRFEPFILLPA
jgi:hypothetical protein